MESPLDRTWTVQDVPARSSSGASPTSWAPDPAALLEIYRGYRRHQVRELLALIPPEALRPLYREAGAALADPAGGVDDPLSLLSAFAESLLPLPPFRVWCEDLLRAPEAQLDEPWMADARPGARAPLPLVSRTERLQGRIWEVHLLVHHVGDGWRGHLTFHANGEDRRLRTGDVFREDRLAAVRERFAEFDRATLEAFLRSVQP